MMVLMDVVQKCKVSEGLFGYERKCSLKICLQEFIEGKKKRKENNTPLLRQHVLSFFIIVVQQLWYLKNTRTQVTFLKEFKMEPEPLCCVHTEHNLIRGIRFTC